MKIFFPYPLRPFGTFGCPLAILLALLLIGTGCRKDKDTTAPSVHILLPGVGHTVSIPDTLLVRVEVSDDQVVKSIWIALTNVDGVPVTPPVVVPVNAPNAIIERAIPVLNEGLLTGNYVLTVRADDGHNTGSAFRQVNVQAAPLRLRALFVTGPIGSGPVPITRIDSVGNVSDFATMGDLSGASVDGGTQHLLLAGGQSAPLLGMPTSDGSSPWQLANQNGLPFPYFRHLRRDPVDGRHYFGNNEGFIRGFLGNGQAQFNTTTQPGYLSVSTAVVGDRLVSAQQAISLPEKRLVSFFYATGVEVVWYPLDLDVVHMDQRSNITALVFGNRNGQGVIQERNVDQGGVFEMRVFTEGTIRAVQRLNAGQWVVALPDKLVRFNYANNTATTLAVGVDAVDLAYEEATGRLYAAVGNEVVLLDPVNGNVLGTLPMSHAVGRILPLLNR